MFLKVTIRKNDVECNYKIIFKSDQISYGNSRHYTINEKNVHCLLMANIDLEQNDKNLISETVYDLAHQLFKYLRTSEICDSPIKFYKIGYLSDNTSVMIKLTHRFYAKTQ